MKILVTGAAGFIGSHLSERLLNLGHEVFAIDCFSDYYQRNLKEKNLIQSLKSEQFHFYEQNILNDLSFLPINEIEFVFHLAAQAGVRASWGSSFKIYTDTNVLGTQKLLELFSVSGVNLKRFIYASSSSVYGNVLELPLNEDTYPKPVSPYGVSKLAAENLVQLYNRNYQMPTVSLRFFTVYGPRQRPDMAFNRFIRMANENNPIPFYGDGFQTRDFTYIDDIVTANVASMDAPSGSIMNIGGGDRISLKDCVTMLEDIMEKHIIIHYHEDQLGDMKHTFADLQKARQFIDYKAKTSLHEGLKLQYQWMKNEIFS